eukprot:1417327-Rhodomonas_salina.2
MALATGPGAAFPRPRARGPLLLGHGTIPLPPTTFRSSLSFRTSAATVGITAAVPVVPLPCGTAGGAAAGRTGTDRPDPMAWYAGPSYHVRLAPYRTRY